MDASDLIRALPNSLRGAGRPHMDEPGCLPDEGRRKRAGRVQPRGARLQSATGPQHHWRRGHDDGRPGVKGDAILARLNHADNARVITTEILRQNPEKIAETSSGEVSPRNRSGFHTVCRDTVEKLGFRQRAIICRAVGSSIEKVYGGTQKLPWK